MFHLSTWGGFYHLLRLFPKWKSTLSSHRLMGTPAPPQAEPKTRDQLCFQPLAESGLCGQNTWVRPPTLSVGVWTGAVAMESSIEVPQNATDRVAIASQMAQMMKSLTATWETLGSIPGSGRSSREGNGNPLQYSCLENSMDTGAWQAPSHGAANSWTWLSDNIFTFTLWNGNPPPGHISKQNYNSKRYMHFQCSLLYYAAIKKNEIIPFAAIWRDLEMVLLNEVSQKKKDKYHISLICGI